MISGLYKIANKTLNVLSILNQNDYAYDEIIADNRDYSWWEAMLFADLPKKFILNDNRFQNQWTSYDCVAYSATNAINTELWYKADKKTICKWKLLADYMRSIWTMWPRWAFVVDWVKASLSLGYIDSYYTVNSLEEILTAIYRYTNPVCTWTSRINWSEINKDWLVRKASSWWAHAINIIWWDKNKQIDSYIWAICLENSYWNDYQDKWHLWIPFSLINKILFWTRKAVVVAPKWTELSQEERLANTLKKKQRD